MGAFCDSCHHRLGTGENLRLDGDQLGAAALGQHLDLAGALEGEHHQEGIGDGAGAGQQAVVMQHQEIVLAQIRLQAGLFLVIERHALIGVIAQAGQYKQRLLADGQYTLLLRTHRYARSSVSVQHAGHVVAHFVDGAVDGVARRVDIVGALHLLIAGLVNLDQARRGDLVEHQPIGVDQEIFSARHLGRNMREDQVIPTVHGHQAIAGREVHAGLPFGGADLGFDVLWRWSRG